MYHLAQDLGGGLVATMPSEQELNYPEISRISPTT